MESKKHVEGHNIAAACAEWSPFAQFCVDRHGRLLYANEKYRSLFGHALWTELLFGERHEAILAEWQQALTHEISFHAEFSIDLGPDCKREELFHVELICSSRDLASPFNGILQDASKQATEKNLLRTLIDTLPDLVYAKDRQSRFLLNNTAHAQHFGVTSPDELVGRSDHDYYPKEIADRCLADELELMESGRSLVNHEEKSTDSPGQELWLLTTKVPLFDLHSKVIGLVGLSRDITELKKAQQSLEVIARQLEESNHQLEVARDEALESSKAKSQFLANMSHEIRTPMNGVIGMTELLKGSDLTEEQREFLDTIAASGQSLLTVINDILDFSKIEAGQLILEKIEFQPSTVFGEVLRLYAPTAETKGLELIGDLAASAELTCIGDPVRLRQVLSNLVGNAIKFTDQGYVLVSASVKRVGDLATIVFSVKDTGIGIPSDRAHAIFESFTQVDATTTRRFGGTGLGLAISRQLVELMGGKLSVQSEVGKGSEFRVEVRLGRSESRIASAPRDISGVRVLVCDDLEVNRRIQVAHLRKAGCIVETATSGREAIDRVADLSKPPIQVLILDYMMPHLNGIDVATALKKLSLPHRPAMLMLTSAANAIKSDDLIALGISCCLDKPIMRAPFLDAVAATIGTPAEKKPAKAIPLHKKSAKTWINVLLVEDNPTNARVGVLMLESLGCKVTTVEDGIGALLKFSDGFDLVLMDCQMPNMDGYEATEMIRIKEADTGGHIPIVAMTASALEQDRQRCLLAGMDDHISKPITRDRLLESIQRNVKQDKAA